MMDKFSFRLQQAIAVGMVRLDGKKAIILSPPAPEKLTDDDWLMLLGAASEVGHELECLHYQVSY